MKRRLMDDAPIEPAADENIPPPPGPKECWRASLVGVLNATIEESLKDAGTEEVVAPIRKVLKETFPDQQDVLGALNLNPVQLGLQEAQVHLKQTELQTHILISSIAVFLANALPQRSVNDLGQRVKQLICKYLATLLRPVHETRVQLSHDRKQARIFTLQAAIHRKYPQIKSSGIGSIARPPVFYGTESCELFKNNDGDSSFDVRTRVAWELLQSPKCFKKISGSYRDHDHPLPTLSLDLASLETEIDRDTANNKVPCAVIARPEDDLEGIRRICDKHSLWLHVEGGSSALLLAAATHPPNATSSLLKCADSICVTPYRWFQTLAVDRQQSEPPCFTNNSTAITYIRSDSFEEPPRAGHTTTADFTNYFTLWHTLESQPIDSTRARVNQCLLLCSQMSTQLTQSELFEAYMGPGSRVPHVLIFQIHPKTGILDVRQLGLNVTSFNDVIGHRCRQELRALNISCCPYNQETVFRFEPLYMKNLMEINESDVNALTRAIGDQVEVLRRTVALRPMFKESLERYTDLQWVDPSDLKSYVGLGAFRFIPPYVQEAEEHLHQLNEDLGRGLEQLNSVFKGRVTEHDLTCIVVLPSEAAASSTVIDPLIDQAYSAAQGLDLPKEVISRMAQEIRRAQNAAQLALEEENAAAYNPDSLLRAMPVLGNIYGWVFPDDTAGRPSMGHTFDILEGKIRRPNTKVAPALPSPVSTPKSKRTRPASTPEQEPTLRTPTRATPEKEPALRRNMDDEKTTSVSVAAQVQPEIQEQTPQKVNNEDLDEGQEQQQQLADHAADKDDICPGARVRLLNIQEGGSMGHVDRQIILKGESRWGITLDSGKRLAMRTQDLELVEPPPEGYRPESLPEMATPTSTSAASVNVGTPVVSAKQKKQVTFAEETKRDLNPALSNVKLKILERQATGLESKQEVEQEQEMNAGVKDLPADSNAETLPDDEVAEEEDLESKQSEVPPDEVARTPVNEIIEHFEEMGKQPQIKQGKDDWDDNSVVTPVASEQTAVQKDSVDVQPEQLPSV